MKMKERLVAVALIAAFLVVTLNTIYEDKFENLTGAARNPKLLTACNDHLDNDGDGYCDYKYGRAYCNDNSIPGDPDCTNKNTNSEGCFPKQEICDGKDNDCDNEIDENACTTTYFCDTDNDNYIGMDVDGTCNTYGCVPEDCSIITGNDCNDQDIAINPGWQENCDNDGRDNDCDGQIDECLNTCTNYRKDGAESDVDCGGSCPSCRNGQQCTTDTDCQSKYCENSYCRDPPSTSLYCDPITINPNSPTITLVASNYDGDYEKFRNDAIQYMANYAQYTIYTMKQETDLGCYTGCYGAPGNLCCNVGIATNLSSICGDTSTVILHNSQDLAYTLYTSWNTYTTTLYPYPLPDCILQNNCG